MSPASQTDDDRLPQLVEGQLRGELTADEKAELAELLDSSQAAQLKFVELVTFETALTEAHLGTTSPVSINDYERSRTGLAKVLPWIAAAACLVYAFWHAPEEPAPKAAEPAALATLANQVDATFVPPRVADDVRFEPGIQELTSGTIHLRFANGADLVIESPARFELIGELQTRLEYGTIRAIVPPTAKGFTIATKTARFEDVGTEFGLRVDRDTSRESLLVFDGQVNVRRGDSHALVSSVQGGEAFEYRDGQPTKAPDVPPDIFPAPGGIGYRHWRSTTQVRLRDRNLIALFTFERDSEHPTLLRNLQLPADTPVSDAQIHGARWGSGRWQEKDALTFDGQDQYAELEITGEFEELTIAAWVQINRLDHPLNAVFNSNGWDRGDIHLQFNRQGLAYTDLYESRLPKKDRWGVGASLADWTHLVATFSLLEGATRVYINGELAYWCALQKESPIQPGTCRIGNWLAVGKFAPVRSFNGRIDELAIWNHALSESEVKTEMRRGQPSFLWARQPPASP